MGDLKNRVELVVCRRLRRQHGAGAAPAELADPVASILTLSASEEQGGSADSRCSAARRPPRTALRATQGSNAKKRERPCRARTLPGSALYRAQAITA